FKFDRSKTTIWTKLVTHSALRRKLITSKITLQRSFMTGEVKKRHNITREITKMCLPKEDPSNISTPFKIYIYDLPKKFNVDVKECMRGKQFSYCYDLDYCGMGSEIYRIDGFKGLYDMSVRDTHMFALEVLIHHKLLHSPYITNDPSKADIFYIPAYIGLQCLCSQVSTESVGKVIEDLFTFLKMQPYFLSGKPHFSTLSKIQREQSSSDCPYLQHTYTKNITFIGIEEEQDQNWAKYLQIQGIYMIVTPYPSYVHFVEKSFEEHSSAFMNDKGIEPDINSTQIYLHTPALENRTIFLFLAAGRRRSNNFRAKIMDQFQIKTELSYPAYIGKTNGLENDHKMVMLYTDECNPNHRSTTIEWMQHAIFCLQPPGDSPTRKSFYDAVLSGCIPVTFRSKFPLRYPFDRLLNYTKFMFTIPEESIEEGGNVLEILRSLSRDYIESMHLNLKRVAHWLQYSIPDSTITESNDALKLILLELGKHYNL
ncbi:hypothetical protein ACJMK2_019410, partial [Sinanodonta woodiana]